MQSCWSWLTFQRCILPLCHQGDSPQSTSTRLHGPISQKALIFTELFHTWSCFPGVLQMWCWLYCFEHWDTSAVFLQNSSRWIYEAYQSIWRKKYYDWHLMLQNVATLLFNLIRSLISWCCYVVKVKVYVKGKCTPPTKCYSMKIRTRHSSKYVHQGFTAGVLWNFRSVPQNFIIFKCVKVTFTDFHVSGWGAYIPYSVLSGLWTVLLIITSDICRKKIMFSLIKNRSIVCCMHMNVIHLHSYIIVNVFFH
jgi:hypothetical protein